MQNIQAALVQMLLTRNLQQDIASLQKFDQTITAAMTAEQREFVRAHWTKLKPFLETETGQIALQTFVGDWQASVQPKQVT